jgi:EAL domain-containing protein (putative c-di-GMP-specific phosphodiesterase class I)
MDVNEQLEQGSRRQTLVQQNTDYGSLTLKSAFQPIISIPHRKTVGYEGLVRAFDKQSQQPISPLDLFKIPKNSAEYLGLDRICRSMHANNFAKQVTGNEWLFLNLDTQCLANEQPHPGFMNSLFELTGLPASRIVIEILESKVHDRDYLNYIVQHFKRKTKKRNSNEKQSKIIMK